MCDQMQLTKTVADVAKQVFKRAKDDNLFPTAKFSNEVIIAACIFLGCRYHNVPRTFGEVASMARVNKKLLGQCFIKLKQHFSAETMLEGLSASKLTSRFGSKVRLPPAVTRAAGAVADKANEIGTVNGRSPLTVAAGCIYFVAFLFGMPRNAKEIQQVAGVTESTIRSVYRQLYVDRFALVKVVEELDENEKMEDSVTPATC